MKAVLRIVQAYFSFLPLQGWVNAAGCVLLAAGVWLTLAAPTPLASMKMTYTVAVPGACLIALLPLGLGGMALRFASSRSLLHLRPHGRASMLLGATLVLALLVSVMTLPIAVEHYVLTKFGVRRMPSSVQPATWFLTFTAFTVGAWLVGFISSSSRVLTVMVPMLPAAGLVAFNTVLSPASGKLILKVMPLAWVLFALWYWRVARIKRPDWVNDQTPVGFDNLAIRPLERLSSIEGGTARGRASRQFLLGSESFLANIATGALAAMLILLVMTSLPDRAMPGLVLFATPLAMIGLTLGSLICRRARYLWLRAGIDRPALFRLAERSGMPSTLLFFGAAAAVLLAASILARPEQALQLVLFGAALGVLTAATFYFGLSLTRGWNVHDVLGGIGLCVLVGVTIGVIKPQQGSSIIGVLVATGLFALLALLLRRLAMRRWHALDWRIAKLPRVHRA